MNPASHAFDHRRRGRSIFVRRATGEPETHANSLWRLCRSDEASREAPDWWTEPDPDHEHQDEGDTDLAPVTVAVQVPGPEVKYLDANQAAAYLGVGTRLIRRLVEERRVTVRKIGRFIRFTREDLDDAVKVQPPIDATTAKRIASKINEDDPVAMVVKRSLSNTPNKARLGIVKDK